MTAAIVLLVTLLAILIGAIWIVRVELRKPDFDYCDACASEPGPLERKKADKRIKQILAAADAEQQRRRARAGDIA